MFDRGKSLLTAPLTLVTPSWQRTWARLFANTKKKLNKNNFLLEDSEVSALRFVPVAPLA